MFSVPLCLLLTATPVTHAPAKNGPTELSVAVKEFNESAKKNDVGKGQPELTEDEVIAAIRGIIREQHPDMTDEVYNLYQKIADDKQLPAGAQFTFLTKWKGYNNHSFDVWWADLHIDLGNKTGYGYRIRDQFIKATPNAKK